MRFMVALGLYNLIYYPIAQNPTFYNLVGVIFSDEVVKEAMDHDLAKDLFPGLYATGASGKTTISLWAKAVINAKNKVHKAGNNKRYGYQGNGQKGHGVRTLHSAVGTGGWAWPFKFIYN